MATDTTTAATADPTLEGKSGDGQGNSDQVIAGLNRSLNKAIAERDKYAQELAKQVQEPEESTDRNDKAAKMERENKFLKKIVDHADVAPILRKAYEKGVDPDIIDDDFVAALRAGARASEETEGTPAHNPVRQTSPESNEDILKRMTSIFSD